MKNHKQEKLKLLQRQYNRSKQWTLQQGGLYVPHAYTEKDPDGLSWYDDVGFILNGRRVIVWWQHPRLIYSDKLDELSLQKCGDGPQDNWLIEDGIKNYKQVGRSRKKIVSYTMRGPSEEQKQYYKQLDIIRQQLATEGIELNILPSCKIKSLTWALGVELVVPMEVRNEKELAMIANLAKRLILRQTTLEAEFPKYSYSRIEWLREQKNI